MLPLFQDFTSSCSQHGLSAPDLAPIRAAMSALSASVRSLDQLAGHILGAPAMPRVVQDQDEEAFGEANQGNQDQEEGMDDSGHPSDDPPSPIIARWDRGTHRCFSNKRCRD